MSAPSTFEVIAPEASSDFARMKVTRLAAAQKAARTIIQNAEHYFPVEAATGVPWFVIGLIHHREADFDFSTHLHNGNPLTHRTTDVPAGRPTTHAPPFTWEESAIDALEYDKLAGITDWSVGRVGYSLEKYNGFGPRNHGVKSGYLWAGSSIYVGGKYIRDRVWDPSYVDTQLGVMVVLKALLALDPRVAPRLGLPPVVSGGAPAPAPVSSASVPGTSSASTAKSAAIAAGGMAVAIAPAAVLGSGVIDPFWVMLAIIAVGVAAGGFAIFILHQIHKDD